MSYSSTNVGELLLPRRRRAPPSSAPTSSSFPNTNLAPRQPPRTMTVPSATPFILAINTRSNRSPHRSVITADNQLALNAAAVLALLQHCSTDRDLHQIHTHLIKSNAIQDPLCYTKLLALYALSDPNQSILLFNSLLGDGPLHIDPHAYPPALKASMKLAALSEGTQLHCLAIKCGVFADPYVMNSTIQMYFGCGRSSYAQHLFDRMTKRNVVTWNCVIAGYAELGLWEDVKSLFKQMVGESVVPNSVTLVRVVTASTRSGDFDTGVMVHRYLVDNGLALGVQLGNALMNMYAKLGKMEDALSLFDQMPDRDVVSWTTLVSGYAGNEYLMLGRELFDMMPSRNIVAWNAMIAGYVQNGCFEEAILLYKEMQVLDVKADKATVITVLSACTRLGVLHIGRTVHGYICKIGIYVTLDLLHSILGLYSKCGDLASAQLLFKKMDCRNEISWTLMMESYVKCGLKESALELFKQMPYRDVASWNALITALAQCNYFTEALNIFEDMRRMNVSPNCLTLASTLSACSMVGALELGKWIHGYIERNEIEMDAYLSSSLIDMYAKCGCIEQSLEVFNSMPVKDLTAWSAMIGGLAMHGRSKLALDFFNEMVDCGIQPDAITFIGVLTACSHAGLVEEGNSYFNQMTRIYGISPTSEHYSCIVDLLGRRGLLREAKDFIDQLRPSSNQEAIWGALLSACRIHGNVGLAEYVTKQVLEVNPTSSGAYVLLSNVYATASMWDGVERVRSTMKKRGIEKVPGCSSIEVNGAVHDFFVGDVYHPQFRDIYILLDGLAKHWKEQDAVESSLDIEHR